MKYFTFQCGCKFPIKEELSDGTLRIEFNPDMNEIPLDCSKTWDLFCAGNTKGIFQLETGQSSLTKQLAPRSIEELSALTALLRPGCMESFLDDGKSLTQHYIDRKNNGEEVTYIHPALAPILDKTYGILTYQEQAIKLATDIAGFSLQEADTLRKAIGKKKPEEMAKIKKVFLDGCERTKVVPMDVAEQIFGWIQASQRYSFNKCLAPTTLVETKAGLKTLDEVQIGELVNSPYGMIEVLDKHENGDKELYEIELESGKTIQCTIDHKFLCESGEKHPLWEILSLGLKISCQDD